MAASLFSPALPQGAIDKLAAALDEYVIAGSQSFAHNSNFLSELCRSDRFRRGATPTRWHNGSIGGGGGRRPHHVAAPVGATGFPRSSHGGTGPFSLVMKSHHISLVAKSHHTLPQRHFADLLSLPLSPSPPLALSLSLSGARPRSFIDEEYPDGFVGVTLDPAERRRAAVAAVLVHASRQTAHAGAEDWVEQGREWVVDLSDDGHCGALAAADGPLAFKVPAPKPAAALPRRGCRARACCGVFAPLTTLLAEAHPLRVVLRSGSARQRLL